MTYEIGQIRIVEARRDKYLKKRRNLIGRETNPDAIWAVIEAADDLAEAIGLAR